MLKVVFSGGHSYTCTNIKQDSVHIDMREMDSIQLIQVMIVGKVRRGRRKTDPSIYDCKGFHIFSNSYIATTKTSLFTICRITAAPQDWQLSWSQELHGAM